MNSTVNKWVLPIKVGALRKRLTANRGRILKDRSHGGGGMKTKLFTNFNFWITLYILE
jgi:hypothetical protein